MTYTGRDGTPDIRARLDAAEAWIEAHKLVQHKRIEAGTVTLNGSGRGTFTYQASFDSEPVVTVTAHDDNGSAINAQVDRHNTSGGDYVSVRIQCDRVEETTPGTLAALFGWNLRRRDNISGVKVYVLAVG